MTGSRTGGPAPRVQRSRSDRRGRRSRTSLATPVLASFLVGALLLPITAQAAPTDPAAVVFPEPSAAELVAADFTLYLVNAGAADVHTVPDGYHLGLYQSSTDQSYGPEARTSAGWGYVTDATSNPVRRETTSTAVVDSLRYDAEPAGADLTTRQVRYDLDLPNGTYNVTFGLAAPSSWGARTVVTTAEGVALETVAAVTTPTERTYAVDVTDGVLNAAAASPPDRTSGLADPLLNYLIVRAQPQWSPDLLAASIEQHTLTESEAAGYAPDTVAALGMALADAQGVLDAGAVDPDRLRAAFEAIDAAHRGLRPVVGYDSFRPGEPWLDTNGQVIQAHGGQVVAATDEAGERIWYWYGEDRTNRYHGSPGVHVYSSHDLYNWTDEGLALRAMETADQFETDPYFVDLYAGYTDQERAAVYRDLDTVQTDPAVNPAIIERPKAIYNAGTGQWVMWIHADGPSATSNAQYAKANAGVAVSDSPTGPFRYIDSYRLHVAPPGEPNHQPDNPGMARDMNLFVDDDGTAYIIYSSEENYSLFISRLDSDYTQLATPAEAAVPGVDFVRPYVGVHREARPGKKPGACSILSIAWRTTSEERSVAPGRVADFAAG